MLPRRDRGGPYVVAQSDRVGSRWQRDRLVNLFRRKLRARSVEHGIVIGAGGSNGQRSRLILAAMATLHLNRHGNVVEFSLVSPGQKRERVPQMRGSQLSTCGISDGIVLVRR